MKNAILFFSAVSILIASATQAQTVDEIIAKHIEAIGGKEILGQFKSVYTENSLEIMGNSSPSVEYLLEGKGFKTETEFNGSKIINCLSENGGWMVNPMMGSSEPTAMPDEAYKSGKAQIYLSGVLINYATKGYKAELTGKENGSYKIKITGNGLESFYFVDEATSFLTKQTSVGEMMGQSVDITTTYADFKKTDFGIILPFSKSVELGQFQLTYIVTKVEVNKEIDPKIFEMPK